MDIPMPEMIRQVAHDLLLWIGFGTLAGLVAKAIMPGRDPGGALATLLMGIGGSVIGCGVLAYFYQGERVTPISLVGFLVATGGAFFLLFFYRLLGNRVIHEGDGAATGRMLLRGFTRRRRSNVTTLDD